MHLADNQTNKTYQAAPTPSSNKRAAHNPGQPIAKAAAWFVVVLMGWSLAAFGDTPSNRPDGGYFGAGQADVGAADFTLPSIADRNQSVTLSDFRGKTVYLDFWSSWCLPCRDSLPLLTRLQETFSERDFAVVTVNLDAHPSDGRALMQKLQLGYPVASDVGWTVAKRFGLQTLPAAFLIQSDGAIHARLPRLDDDSYARVAAVIDAQLRHHSATNGG